MTRSVVSLASKAVLLLALAVTVFAQDPAPSRGALTGTAWQMVRFVGGDDTVVTPDDRSKYTIAFGDDGRASVRIDCNRGTGTWTSTGPNQVAFGPIALTRAMCPPGSLHDRLARDLGYIRSYLLKDGHLFLSLMADAGTYEFEPIAASKPEPSAAPVVSTGPFTFSCAASGAAAGTITATFYRTTPAMVLVERDGRARPAFEVPAASGVKYEGLEVTFWEARSEVSVTWSGRALTCRKL